MFRLFSCSCLKLVCHFRKHFLRFNLEVLCILGIVLCSCCSDSWISFVDFWFFNALCCMKGVTIVVVVWRHIIWVASFIFRSWHGYFEASFSGKSCYFRLNILFTALVSSIKLAFCGQTTVGRHEDFFKHLSWNAMLSILFTVRGRRRWRQVRRLLVFLLILRVWITFFIGICLWRQA